MSDSPTVVLQCSSETLSAIRDGRQRALLLPSSKQLAVDFAIIFKHAEQISSGIVTHIEQLDGDDMVLVSFNRIWTHSSGDEYENAVTLIEKACQNFRRLSHAGQGTDAQYEDAARTLASHGELWSAIVATVLPKKERKR